MSGTKARIVITDVTEAPIGGNYIFVTSAGTAIGSAADFCGQIASVGIPSNAARLVVYIAGPVFGPLACIEEGYPGVGTNGSVTLTAT